MAETYDPELASMLDTLRKARLRRDYNKTWQGLGAFADAYRTGMPGAEALAMREPPKDYYTQAEKTEMALPVLQQKEEATREWGALGMGQSLKLFQERSQNARSKADAIARVAEASGQIALGKGRALVDREELELREAADVAKRTTQLDDDQRKALAGVLAPAPGGKVYEQLAQMVEADVLAREGVIETPEGFVKRDAYGNETPLTEAQIGDLVTAAQREVARKSEALATGDFAGDPRLQALATENGRERAPTLAGLLRAAPGALPGEKAKLLEAFSEQTGIPPEELLGGLDDGLRTAVEQDLKMREGLLAKTGADVERAAVAAQQALARAGVPTQNFEAAIGNLQTLSEQGLDTMAGPEGTTSPEAVGAPAEDPAAAGPEGVGAQAAPPAPDTEGALTDSPQARYWRELGLAGVPPGSGIEYLDAMLTQIENLPSLPAVQLAKQNLMNSPQYQEWKQKHGIQADSDLVFRAFTRDSRSRIGEARKKSAQQIHDAAAAGEIKGLAVPAMLPRPKAAERYRSHLPQPQPPGTGIPDPQEPQEQPVAPAPVR